jgi:cysteine desulfurase
MNSIYLDNNSTTKISPTVAAVIADCHRQGFVNPASQHQLGQAARRLLERLRSEMIAMVGGVSTGMQTDQLIITSGGTESNNLALFGLATTASRTFTEMDLDLDQLRPRIVVSSVEHPSVLSFAKYLGTTDFDVLTLNVDGDGRISLEHLQQLLSTHNQHPIAVVSIMAANNETGVIQPVDQAGKLCRDHGVLFHCDAVQVVGKSKINFSQLNVDSMSMTAHKFHGPRGVGGLIVKHGVQLEPLLYGGFQQMAARPGTEDVALVAGMHQALKEFHADPLREQRIANLRDRLEQGLYSICPDMIVNGGHADRMAHTLNVSFPGIDRQAFLLAADFAGLAISTGSACASGSSDPSHVIIAMGANNDVVEGSIRFSLGAENTEQEIDTCLTVCKRVINRLSPATDSV